MKVSFGMGQCAADPLTAPVGSTRIRPTHRFAFVAAGVRVVRVSDSDEGAARRAVHGWALG